MTPYWRDEAHDLAIYHGDCLEAMPALGREFDLCLTDPPYNVGYNYATHDDRMPVDEYRAWQLAVAEAVAEVTAPVADFWYLHYPEFAAYMFSAVPETTSWEAREWVTWVYHTHTGGSPLRKASRAWCWFAKGGGREATFEMVERICGGIDCGIVLDPFLGSGTTLVACYRRGRSGVGIEISEEYCELAARRLEQEMAQGRLFEPEEV